MAYFAYFISVIIRFIDGITNRFLLFFYRKMFKECGSHVYFKPLSVSFSYNTIKIGSDVYVGPGAIFSSIKGIEIGNKVTFGPRVVIMAGDHNIKKIGMYIFDNKIKDINDDLPVKICDDVWVGCNVTILKGVTLGKGSVIGAGAVVTRNVPPYAIVCGNPARIIKYRFDGNPASILQNEIALYPSQCQLSESDINDLLNMYPRQTHQNSSE